MVTYFSVNKLRLSGCQKLEFLSNQIYSCLILRIKEGYNLLPLLYDFVFQICKISFQLTAPLDAIGQFRKHIDYFKQKCGPSELLFEHYAWMAKQYEQITFSINIRGAGIPDGK